MQYSLDFKVSIKWFSYCVCVTNLSAQLFCMEAAEVEKLRKRCAELEEQNKKYVAEMNVHKQSSNDDQKEELAQIEELTNKFSEAQQLLHTLSDNPLANEIRSWLDRAKHYYWGDEGTKDYEQSRLLFERVAEQQCDKVSQAWAWVWLGRTYVLGHGVTKDYERAWNFFEKARNQENNPRAQLWAYGGFGHILYQKEQYEQALKYFDLAEKQDIDFFAKASAWSWLARLYTLGQGVQKDAKKAFEYSKKAANQNENLEAQAVAWILLGDSFWEGRGVSQSYSHAIQFYTKAAEQSHFNEARRTAQLSLGIVYFRGSGIEKNYERAAYFFNLLALQEDDASLRVTAWQWLANLYYEKEEKNRALEFLEMVAVEDAFPAKQRWARLELCSLYFNDASYQNAWYCGELLANQTEDNQLTVEAWMMLVRISLKCGNIKLCWPYCCKLIDQNHDLIIRAWALQTVGNLYRSCKDFVTAFDYFRQASLQNENKFIQAEAHMRLGVSYYYGEGVNKDYTKACEHFTLAAEQESNKAAQEEAQSFLARLCYLFKNDELCRGYLELSMRASNQRIADWAHDEFKKLYPEECRKNDDECVIL